MLINNKALTKLVVWLMGFYLRGFGILFTMGSLIATWRGVKMIVVSGSGYLPLVLTLSCVAIGMLMYKFADKIACCFGLIKTE